MATSTSYGSITIVDITDIGEFSVYPTGNLPLSVIYSPDQGSSATAYTPNWGTSNLTLTPTVYYAGHQLALNTSGLTITWKRQEGTSGATETLNTGESVSGGILTVSANQFTPSSTMLTYIVVASYVEPTSGQTLTAQGQMTFTLVKQASSIKDCSITGETVFKYNTSGTLVGASSITLLGTLNNVSISAWKYKNGNNEWVTYPYNTGDSSSSTSLTVRAVDNVFINDVATIKLVTSDPDVYDIHSITKLRDGAVGAGTITAVLTNDDQMIPYTSAGVGDFTDAVSRVIVYEGGTDVTSQWTITQTYSNVTATASTTTKANDTVTVTAMSANTGSVTFTCSKSGQNNIVKTFSLVKVTSGANGVTPTIYSLTASTLAINKNISGVLNPTTVTFYGWSKEGNANKVAYSGRFKIFENGSTTASYTSSSNESSHEYTPSSSATKITCNLYAGGGTSTLYDTQTVVITSDGATGQQGPQGNAGVSAVNVILGNQADVIPCTSANKTQTAMTITIPFAGYLGTTKVACSLVTSASNIQIGGVTPTVNQANATTDGSIVYSIASNTSISAASGTISLEFSCEDQSITHTYRWTRSTAATNGTNAVILQVFAPQGNIFNNGDGTLYAQASLYSGNAEATGETYKWYQYKNGSYVEVNSTNTPHVATGYLSGSTWTAASNNSTTATMIKIEADAIDGYGSFKVESTLSSKTYTQFISFLDKSDPIQVTVFSSLGSQIVNGNGYGALYVKVARNGVEIDPMKTETFSTTAPTSPATNDYYYHVDSTNKTITLKKYNGSSWVIESETFTATYSWTYQDGFGTPVSPTGLATTGKIIYIDGDLVNGKIVANVEVTVD